MEKVIAKVKPVILVICFILQCTWGFAQNLLGLLIRLKYLKNKCYIFRTSIVTIWDKNYNIGCGMFIFLSGNKRYVDTLKDKKEKYDTLVHEYGHSIQSIILGPLFIPIIAIPSLVWAFSKTFQRMRIKNNTSYYWLYCELWANMIGDKICNNKRG